MMVRSKLIVTIILSLNILSLNSAKDNQPDPGLLGLWEFTSSNIIDNNVHDKGKTGNATIIGSSTLSVTPELESLILDGKTSVEITDNTKSVPLPIRALTVEAWVYISRPLEHGGIIGVFDNNENSEKGWFLGYQKDRFCLGVSSEIRGKMFCLYAENAFEMNRWYHVTGTYNGEQMKIYVNGQLENMSKYSRYDIGYSIKASYEIGAYRAKDINCPMEGMIHEVRVYNRVLNEGEIRRQIFQQNYPVPMIVTGPYLQQGTKSTQTIMWETSETGTSVVEYGEQAPLSLRAENIEPKTIHEITLSNLKPQTQYFYRISTKTSKNMLISPIYTFQTAVVPGSAFSFVVMGDTFTWVPDFERKRIFDCAWAERPNFVVHVGDVVPDGNKKEQWPMEWLLPAGELMSRVPVYVAIGNHEENAHWFYDYMSYPQPENFYSFDYGNAHFVILDSNKLKEIALGGKQYQWFDKDMRESKATWKFVFLHHPLYSSDDDDYGDTWNGKASTLGDLQTRKLAPLFEKHKVDIVWSGHIHFYERTWPIRAGKIDQKNGVTYIQTGGGGSDLEEPSPVRSWFTAKVLRSWEYCIISINDKTLHMMTYDINGNMFDYLDIIPKK